MAVTEPLSAVTAGSISTVTSSWNSSLIASGTPSPLTAVLIWRPKVPLNSMPGMLSSTEASISAASPSPGNIRNRPTPSETMTKSVVPSPRRRPTLEAETFTTSRGGVPGTWSFSKAKLPVRVWPRMVSRTSRPATRRNGPAGRSRMTASSPTMMTSSTAVMRLLMARRKLPDRLNLSGPRPGTLTATVPLMSAARPSLSSSSAPWPSPRTTIPRTSRLTLVAATRMTLRPVAVVERSKTKSPLKLKPSSATPSRSKSNPRAKLRTSTRRNGPAGSVVGIPWPRPSTSSRKATSSVAASSRLLINSVTVVGSTTIPGRLKLAVARTKPASPAFVISIAAVPSLISRRLVSPALRLRPMPEAVSFRIRTSSAVPTMPSGPLLLLCSNAIRSACSTCPTISSLAGPSGAPSSFASTPVTSTRRKVPAGRSMSICSAPRVKLRTTSCCDWFIASAKAPLRETASPRFNSTETEKRAASRLPPGGAVGS